MKVFELLVYSIAGLALLLLFFSLLPYFFPPETSTKQIMKAVEEAQTLTMIGKTMNLGALSYSKDYHLFKEDFDEKNFLIAFECASAKECCIKKSDQGKNYACENPIEWDYNFIKIKETKKITTAVRCTREKGFNLCKIYVAGLPAQAKVDKIELLNTSGGTGEIKLTLKNIGLNELAFGKNSLILYKKSENSWIETDYASEEKEVSTIMPGEKETIFWSINPKNAGEYKALFRFEAQNAGFDENSIIFTLDKTSLCNTNETQAETFFDPETSTYQETHYCTGCSYSFECANAWNKKTGKPFYPATKDSAYCTKTTYEGSC